MISLKMHYQNILHSMKIAVIFFWPVFGMTDWSFSFICVNVGFICQIFMLITDEVCMNKLFVS